VLAFGVLYSAFQLAVGSASGCTQEVVKRFERLKLAKDYRGFYVSYIEQQEQLDIWAFVWEITPQAEGCVLEARATGSVYGSSSTTMITFKGDRFFVNLSERKVYAQSEGARLLLSGKAINLP
jgi:hypothetical protein